MNLKKVNVSLWGTEIGIIELRNDNKYYFTYNKKFLNSGIQLSPIHMKLREEAYEFSSRDLDETFKGLPGLVIDSLPDKFGNLLIEQYFASQGRSIESITPLEKLCYIGKRGMGALEYSPASQGNTLKGSETLELEELIDLCNQVLASKENINVSQDDIKSLIKIGTSAGGSRAKAIVAYNLNEKKFKSGQVDAGKGYEYYIIKFDGIKENKDKDSIDSIYQTRIEYAYYLMARDAKINMMDSFQFEKNGLFHFMTKRFDRVILNGKVSKLHTQTLCALAHLPFHITRYYGYEQVVNIMKELNMPQSDIEEFYRRMVFNVICRNQDDHVKNISFIMDRSGKWRLSPAYDMTYAFDPTGSWTNMHQMLINGKYNDITYDDLINSGKTMGISLSTIRKIIVDVKTAALKFNIFAIKANIPNEIILDIKSKFILIND